MTILLMGAEPSRLFSPHDPGTALAPTAKAIPVSTALSRPVAQAVAASPTTTFPLLALMMTPHSMRVAIGKGWRCGVGYCWTLLDGELIRFNNDEQQLLGAIDSQSQSMLTRRNAHRDTKPT